jgi:protocatechuate 3,4-dioxygenase beta subunit
LGWTLNEVRGRLERARGRLRKRLERRGITLSAGLLAAVGIETLHPTLVRAAVAGAAHPTGRVAELATVGAIGKARIALALVVVTGLVAATGLGPAGPRAGAGATDPPAKDAPKAVDAPKDERAIRGRVVDPDGQPVAGAVVWRLEFREPAREVARSDAGGRFAVAADPQTDLTRTHGGGRVHLAATKDGFGMALPPERFNAAELVLKLVKDDAPVRGRILDLQGKPVAGVTVAPLEVWATPDESLADWLKALPTDDAPRQLTGNRFRRKADPPPGLIPVKTDETGRFTFAGIGRERLLRLRVTGPTVATAETDAVTRDLPAVRVQYDRGNPKLGQVTYHGAAFDFAADPTQPFEGVVRDQESGKPIAGALVRCDYPYRIETTAGADGRYRLIGLPPGEHRLVATPPAGVACLPLLQPAGRANNEKPVGLNFVLARGAGLRGR